EAATTPMTRAIFVNSPANPSGWVASRETLQEILLFARRHRLWIIADEIYSRFVYDGTARAPSFLDIAEPQDRVVYVNTFSKNWAMTGWRMGWIHAPVALRQTLENLIHYSTCGVAQFMQQAGVVALNEGEWYIEHTVERARVGREIVSKEFQHHNRVIYTEPAGAFYSFFRVEGLENAKETAFRLIDEAAVGTAPGDAFGSNGDGFVRICFARSPESLGDAMARIGRFLGS
ncbi:MAG: aminotransferase class I/II-fold pyridoxal phosphate-dependent enzyme, partial [Pseudomonadota bacterium]